MAVHGTVIHRPWTKKAGAFVLVACGLLLTKLCVLDVLGEARAHADSVSLSFKGVILAPVLLLGGVVAFYAALTSDGKAGRLQQRMTNPQTQRLSAFGWAMVLVTLVPGAALYFWLRAQLVSLGYDV